MDPTWLAQLTAYVREARAAGQTYEEVRQALLAGGWSEEAVEEYLPAAWAQAEAPAGPPTPQGPYAPSTPNVYMPPSYGPSVPSYPPLAAVAPPGLGAWLNKGWEMMSGAAGTIIGAFIIVILISVVSLAICAPPLSIGFNMMLLKRHDGQPMAVGDVFEGFRYFWSSWGAFLLAWLIGFVAAFIVSLPFGFWAGFWAVFEGNDIPDISPGLGMLSQVISGLISLLIGPFLIFVFPYIADGRGGVFEAFSASFQTGKRAYGMILLAFFVVSILIYAGMLACGVGILFTAPLGTCILTAIYRTYFPARGTQTGY